MQIFEKIYKSIGFYLFFMMFSIFITKFVIKINYDRVLCFSENYFSKGNNLIKYVPMQQNILNDKFAIKQQKS